MRRAALVFAVWGVWLGVWTAAQLLFLHATLPEQTIQWVMLGGASAAALLTGAAVGRAGPRHEGAAQLITNESVASATAMVARPARKDAHRTAAQPRRTRRMPIR